MSEEPQAIADIIIDSPMPYQRLISSSQFRVGLTNYQRRRALEQLFGDKNVELLPNNNAKIISKGFIEKCANYSLAKTSYSGMNLGIKPDEFQIHYRVVTKTPRSRVPWYSISDDKIGQLEEANIEDVVLLYYIEDGSLYTVRYKIITIDEIKNNWAEDKDTQRTIPLRRSLRHRYT